MSEAQHRRNGSQDAFDIIEVLEMVLVIGAWHVAPRRLGRPHIDELSVAVGAARLGLYPIGFAGRLGPDDHDDLSLGKRIANLDFEIAPAFERMIPPHRARAVLRLDRGGKRASEVAVFRRIADEYWFHARPGPDMAQADYQEAGSSLSAIWASAIDD